MPRNGNTFVLLLLHGSICMGNKVYNFLHLEDKPLNFTSTRERCVSMPEGDIPVISSLDDYKHLSDCAERHGMNDTYWIRTSADDSTLFKEEPESWKCDFEPDDVCFMKDINNTWSKFYKPFEAFHGSYQYESGEINNEERGFYLESGTLPGKRLCFLLHYKVYGKVVGTLSVATTADDKDKTFGNLLIVNTTDIGEGWNDVIVDIPFNAKKMKIIVKSKSHLSAYFALDNLRLKYGNCSLYHKLLDKKCRDISYSERGMILSPNYPHEYDPSSRCTWEITVKKGMYIEFYVHDFELGQTQCLDYLEVIDLVNGQDSLRFCQGSVHPGQSFTMSTNKVKLTFSSANESHGTGFNVTWNAVLQNCSSVNLNDRNLNIVYKPCSDLLKNIVCESGVNDKEMQCMLNQSLNSEERSTLIESTTSVPFFSSPSNQSSETTDFGAFLVTTTQIAANAESTSDKKTTASSVITTPLNVYFGSFPTTSHESTESIGYRASSLATTQLTVNAASTTDGNTSASAAIAPVTTTHFNVQSDASDQNKSTNTSKLTVGVSVTISLLVIGSIATVVSLIYCRQKKRKHFFGEQNSCVLYMNSVHYVNEVQGQDILTNIEQRRGSEENGPIYYTVD